MYITSCYFHHISSHTTSYCIYIISLLLPHVILTSPHLIYLYHDIGLFTLYHLMLHHVKYYLFTLCYLILYLSYLRLHRVRFTLFDLMLPYVIFTLYHLMLPHVVLNLYHLMLSYITFKLSQPLGMVFILLTCGL